MTCKVVRVLKQRLFFSDAEFEALADERNCLGEGCRILEGRIGLPLLELSLRLLSRHQQEVRQVKQRSQLIARIDKHLAEFWHFYRLPFRQVVFLRGCESLVADFE